MAYTKQLPCRLSASEIHFTKHALSRFVQRSHRPNRSKKGGVKEVALRLLLEVSEKVPLVRGDVPQFYILDNKEYRFVLKKEGRNKFLVITICVIKK